MEKIGKSGYSWTVLRLQRELAQCGFSSIALGLSEGSRADYRAGPRVQMNDCVLHGQRRRISVASALPAIDVQDFSRNEWRRIEKEDSVGDIACFAQPSDGVESPQRFVNFGRVHRRLYVAGRDGIHADSLLRVFDRQ